VRRRRWLTPARRGSRCGAQQLCFLHNVAGQILVTAGDNPDRLTSDASFANLCGVAPLEASSGQVVRHRPNRGGDRQANNALWRVGIVRMGTDDKTKAYVSRRTAEGKRRRRSSGA